VHSPFELRQDAEGDAPTRDGVRLLEPACDDGKGRACLLDRNAGPESSHDEVATLPAVLDPYRHEELRPQTHLDAMKALGSNADDREGLRAQGDGPAQDPGIAAEAAAPEAVAQDDDRGYGPLCLESLRVLLGDQRERLGARAVARVLL
jgi:hypothetical protein